MPVPRRSSPTTRLAAGLLAVALVGSGCSADDTSSTGSPPTTADQALTVPTDATELVVYLGGRAASLEPVIDGFAESSGVAVATVVGESGAMIDRLLAEGVDTDADVYVADDLSFLGAARDADLLAVLPVEVVEPVDASHRADDGTWVGISARVRVVAAGRGFADSAPDTVDGLLDPQWNGRIGFAPNDVSWQGFVTGLRALRGESGARSWLEAFRAGGPVPYADSAAIIAAVATGEIAFGLVDHDEVPPGTPAGSDQAPAVVVKHLAAGDPGGLALRTGAGVLATSDAADAALDLVGYLLGPVGQSQIASSTLDLPLAAPDATNPAIPSLGSLRPPMVAVEITSSPAERSATLRLLADIGLVPR